MKRLTRLIPILVIALAAAGPARAEQAEQERIDMLRAAFTMNFMKFTQWPEGVMPGEDEPLELVVVGDDQMASALATTLAGRQVQGRDVQIKSVEWPNEQPADRDESGQAEQQFYRQLSDAHALFLGASDSGWAEAVARRFQREPILMIADELASIDSGVHLAMGVDQGRIVFEAGLDAIKVSPLAISSRLLKLARKHD